MRGMGGIYRRGNVWWIHYSARGKRYHESAKSTERSQAVRLLKRRLSEIGRGRLVGPDIERTRLDDLAAMITTDYRINNRRSAKRLQQSLTHLMRAFRGVPAIDLTPDRIGVYIADRQAEGAANATINRELSALVRMFHLGKRAGKVDRVPEVSKLTEDNVRTGFLEPTQFHALLPQFCPELQASLHVAYITGWRIKSEILTRQWSHVDLGGGWLHLAPGEAKNRDGRSFPLTPELRAILQTQWTTTQALQRRTDRVIPWVFHRRGKPIKDFRGAWQTACQNAGLPWLIPHDFRRTAVRNLERAGIPRSAAMKMVGHKTESIYRRYAIAEETMLREAGEKLSAFHQATQRPGQRKTSVTVDKNRYRSVTKSVHRGGSRRKSES